MPDTTVDTNSSSGGGNTGWARRFAINVFWTWVGVAATFLTGFIVSPYIVRKLGDTRYGIWALAFAFMEYFALVDFGFKSAAVTMISRSRAEQDERGISEVVSTSLFYFVVISAVLLLAMLGASGHLHRFFNIGPEYRDDFTNVVRLVACGWAVAIALNVNQAVLEAFQLFKTQNRIWISGLLLRSAGCVIALHYGYGLVAIALITMLGQWYVQALSFVSVRRAFPPLRISPGLVRLAVWKKMASYGVHAFGGYIGGLLLNQGPAVVIAAMRPAAAVGYYTLPSRLLQYAVDLIARIGFVTVPNAAEMAAQGRIEEVASTTTALNRYCFALYIPCAVFLLIWGIDLIAVWIDPRFAIAAGPLLTPAILSTTLAIAAHYNAVAALFGLARHKSYARTVLLEGVLVLAGIAIALYFSDLTAAAWTAAGLTLANRGLVTPLLFCRAVGASVSNYFRHVYMAPLLLSVPVFAAGLWLKESLIAGRNWAELTAAAALTGAAYFVPAWFVVIEREHRSVLQRWIRNALRRMHVKLAV